MKSRLFLFLLFLYSYISGYTQVLDDSTKQVYSEKTVDFFYENDIQKNRRIINHPDTIISIFDQQIGRKGLFQDLGNVGTASLPFIPLPNENLFVTKGFHVFDRYKKRIDEIRYYNTKSPYTDMDYMQSNLGFSRLVFLHSQNINPRLNFALYVDKYNASKQYGSTQSEEKLVDHWDYHLSSNYRSKNNRLLILSTFYHFNHAQFEQGGIKGQARLEIDKNSLESNYRRSYSAQLVGNPYNRERENTWHNYFQFSKKDGLQLFGTFDFSRENHIMYDPEIKENLVIYNVSQRDTVGKRLQDTLFVRTIQTAAIASLGFKGRYRNFTYDAYGKTRYVVLKNKPEYQDSRVELLAGGSMELYFKDSSNFLRAKSEVSNSGLFWQGQLQYNRWQILYHQSFNPPSFLQSQYDNGIVRWRNRDDLKFNNVIQSMFQAELPINLRKLTCTPHLSFVWYENYIFFNNRNLPSQLKDELTLFHLGGHVKYNSKKLFIKSDFMIHNPNIDSVYALPGFSLTNTIETNFKYAKVLKLFIGIETSYMSSYNALSYSPLINQFVNQNAEKTDELRRNANVKAWDFIQIDPYVRFQINKVRLSLQFKNVTQSIGNLGGYFTTPFYLANPRTFYFHVNWPLFD
ncbi:MAG: putative porin [Leadbetterella sp.]